MQTGHHLLTPRGGDRERSLTTSPRPLEPDDDGDGDTARGIMRSRSQAQERRRIAAIGRAINAQPCASPLFKKLLVVNRGEIAIRIMKGAKALGLSTVAIYAAADKGALHIEVSIALSHVICDLVDGPCAHPSRRLSVSKAFRRHYPITPIPSSSRPTRRLVLRCCNGHGTLPRPRDAPSMA